MSPMDREHSTEVEWSVVGPESSLTTTGDDAVLILRLGQSVNAIRAAQRFYLYAARGSGMAASRDQLIAFLTGVGWVVEALIGLRKRPTDLARVCSLAREDGSPNSDIERLTAMLGTDNALTTKLARVRDKLTFHWDRGSALSWIQDRDPGEVLWAQGVGDRNGDLVWRASSDVVANQIEPPEPGETREQSEERAKQFIQDFLPVMTLVVNVFERAIRSFLKKQRATLRES
jgi:hypothetical protein